MNFNKMNSSFNQKGISTILINAKANVTTQPANSDNLQIANTQYVTNVSNDLKLIILNKFTEAMSSVNIVKYEHININNVLITQPYSYYILNIYNIIVDIKCDVYLPISINEGNIINIINNSSLYINVYTQNDELMYSSLYLDPDGSLIFQLPTNKLLKFYNIKSENLFSWIIIS